jgi:signal transduction histidine kinase
MESHRVEPSPSAHEPIPSAGPGERAGAQGSRGGFLGLGLYRSSRRRVIGGVAGGIGELLGIDPVLVRIAFALLSLSGVAGVILYVVLWATVPEDRGEMAVKEAGLVRAAAMGLVVLGVVVLLREGGLWLGDPLAWSVGLAGLGVAVIWLRSDHAERDRWSRIAERLPESSLETLVEDRPGRIRLLIGALLFAAGVATFVVRGDLLNAAPSVVFAVAVTVTGLGVLFGPWAWRLVKQLSEERRERIRSQERAEMAAHLHDSVLQTLALIQRTDQAREMVALARNQERELRSWLVGSARPGDATLSGAIAAAASGVELQFKVPIEVVTVGDAPLDDRGQAVVDACREALVNAAKHSGADRVSVYLEVEPQAYTAFVRDGGAGFDLDAVAGDRRGLSESIRGRVERSGGSVTIVTEKGVGTEVQLSMPRARG